MQKLFRVSTLSIVQPYPEHQYNETPWQRMPESSVSKVSSAFSRTTFLVLFHAGVWCATINSTLRVETKYKKKFARFNTIHHHHQSATTSHFTHKLLTNAFWSINEINFAANCNLLLFVLRVLWCRWKSSLKRVFESTIGTKTSDKKCCGWWCNKWPLRVP